MNKNIKKGIFTLSIIIFIIITIILILIAVSKKENDISMHQEQKEPYNYKAFELNGNEDSNMECKNGMYYKKIYTYEDYKKYKELWNDIIDVNENSFSDNFMIIGIADSVSIYGFKLGKLYYTDNILYIGLQKDKESESQGGISILLSKELDRENLEIYKSI